MTFSKRLFDLLLALMLSALLAPLIIGIAVWLRYRDGGEIFYRSERMKTADRGFCLWKFRTMTNVATDGGVSGGDKAQRITETGRFLRRYRLDELPQLWNILKGDMSFVGPRPPLREYVERFPDVYRDVLTSRPGVTGLATLLIHTREARLLAQSRSASETDAIYVRRCIPVKARLDLIYQRNASLPFDIWIMWRTVVMVFGGDFRAIRRPSTTVLTARATGRQAL